MFPDAMELLRRNRLFVPVPVVFVVHALPELAFFAAVALGLAVGAQLGFRFWGILNAKLLLNSPPF